MASTIISMTPDELRSTATELQNKKEELYGLIREIDTLVTTCTDNWSGLAQENFLADYDSKLSELNGTVGDISDTLSSNLNQAADILDEADQQIASLFSA